MVVSGGSSSQQPAPPPPPDVNNIMGGIEQTVGVRMHNHRRKLRQRFDLVRKLGQGTYGKVQLGINKETGQEVAIKTIKKAKIETEADLIRIRREIQIMSSVRHPNIIHIYEVFENKEKMVLVMEYAAGGELYDYLSQRKVLSETEARRVFRQVASAVYYCHKHNICHRDLKLENILLDESKTAKIADFGLSNVFDDRRLLTTFCGSPLYASPEIVRGTPYHGPEVDCWSLGVLLYTLVYGAMPFDGSNFKRLVKQISSGEYYEPPDKPSTASPLVRHMLLVDPLKRANVEDICSHWWVNEGYGESCLEVAEELANQTPVRLDLLLSLVPPPESTETVVVGPKTDVSQSTQPTAVAKAGDSMNEYYTAVKDKTPNETTAGAAESAAAKSAMKKKKEGSQHGKEADDKATSKRRRAESKPSIDDRVVGSFERAEDVESSAGPSPIDDSGIQTSLQEEQVTDGVGEEKPGEVLISSKSEETKPIVTDVDMDEGISTSSSWTRTAAVASQPHQGAPVAGSLAHPAVNRSSLQVANLTGTAISAAAGIASTCTTTTSSCSSSTAPPTTIPSQSATSSICPSIEPQSSCVGSQHSPTTPVADDVSTTTRPTDPAANDDIVAAAAMGPPSPAPSPLVTCTATGQPSESHLGEAKMDAKGAVPAAAAAVVTLLPEPENPTSAQQPPAHQIPSPPPFTPPPPPPPQLLLTDDSKTVTKEVRPESSAPAVANRRPPNSAAGGHAADQRHSKILRQAEMFNTLVLNQSRNDGSAPKSTMTLERPKKVTIYGYKLNETRKPFESRSEPKVPTIVPVLKVSDAKRAFENSVAARSDQRNTTAPSHSHNSLPRRTLIQTPASSASDTLLPKPRPAVASQEPDRLQSAGVQPGEKVVVGGLGVKIGAIGKVTEIGMKVKTEENHQPVAQKTLKTKSKSNNDNKIDKPSEAKPDPVDSIKENNIPVVKQPTTGEEPAKVKEIPVILDTGDSEPKVASMLIASGPPKNSPPPPVRPTTLTEVVPSKLSERVASPPPKAIRVTSPPPRPAVLPTASVSPPLIRPLSPPNRPLSPPGSSSRPMSPVYVSAELPTDRTEDDCIAGSENAFIRGIRSPTRDHPPAMTTLKRFSKGPGELPSAAPATEAVSEPKPIQKAEINIAVSATSLCAAPRERIIPIRVEGRELQPLQPIAILPVATTVGLAATESTKTLPKSLNSISVQLRATPPRVTSPPPIKPLAVRPACTTSRQESSAPEMSENKLSRDPLRKSPREFIIPITVEGAAGAQSATIDTTTTRTSRFDRTKRYGSLYHEGETDFDQPSTDRHSASPLHHLQRLSSFKKSNDEPETRGRRGSDSSVDDDDDDDDDTFQILTAESLFSTLLSRVRQLTRRNQRTENASDPFVVFRNASRFASPTRSSTGRSRTSDGDMQRDSEDISQMSSPGCSSPTHHNNNRNSTGSDLLAASASKQWNNVYTRASSVASESDARRYSTLDPPRFYGDTLSPSQPPQLPQPQPAAAGPPWRRETSVDGDSNCSIASASMSPRGTALHSPDNGEDYSSLSSRPFTSSLTRRILNQHLKETNPELMQGQQNNSDAMSEASSASGGNRSSLSWTLSRLTGGLPPDCRPSRRDSTQYSRTHSSRELGSDQVETRRTYQRYGRSSTLDNIDPSAAGAGFSQRLGSPLSDDEQPTSGISTPASYRTYTRTRSREFLSPNSSRGTSPVPSNIVTSPEAIVMNPIVPQLSTVLENGPLGVEGESSPRPVRAAETKLAVITTLNPATVLPPVDASSDRKSRRISRFLRPDFYDAQESADKQLEKVKLKPVEQRLEKYNPDAALIALPRNGAGERNVPVLKERAPPAPIPSSPLQPLLQARQNLMPIPISQPAQPALPPPAGASVVLKPVPEPPQSEGINSKIQQPVLKPVNGAEQAAQTSPKTNGTKSSPKLTVRRQFEHLINLAAAQFSRSQSPSKTAQPAPAPVPVLSQSEAISMELKQLEDEIKNTAAIKAQATARLDALKHELALKSGAAAPKPPIPVKPEFLARPAAADVPIPPEFQPFQYKGSNGTLRELSHLSHARREALSPPVHPENNGRTPPAFVDGDESVRFARIKRVEQSPYDWASDAMDAPGTPTDSYESSSVCSDLRDQRAVDSGEDESVSERIFRKSFYTRFNEPSKMKQHRRSMNRELTPSGEPTADNSANDPPPPPMIRRSSQHRKSLRDESAESVMVRKFLSGDSTGHFDRERRLSTTRRQHVTCDLSDASVEAPPVSGSREPSVARSAKSDQSSQPQPAMTSPTPSIVGSDGGSNGRESRSYLRTYSSRTNDPPSNVTSPVETYSSASLGRRSFYPSSTSSSNADHISSLPRRSNRYSIHEHPESVRLRSTGSVLASRSSYVNPPSSRYSSILLEENGNNNGQASAVLSPNSARRHANLSEALTRRESTFYGTPSHLSSRSGSASSSSAYFMRSTSSGLDHHHNNGNGSGINAGNYATMRPSLLRHRR